MSLTDKTYKQLAILAAQKQELDEFVFGQFDDRELTAFISRLVSLKERLVKAHLKAALDSED